MVAYRVFGDSHCYALSGGFGLLHQSGEVSPFKLAGFNMLAAAPVFYDDFFRVDSKDNIFLTSKIFKGRTSGLCDDSGKLIFSENQAFIISLGTHTQSILASRLFAQSSPYFVSPSLGKRFLSIKALNVILEQYHAQIFSFIKALKGVGADFLFVTAPPPTRRYKIFKHGYADAEVILLDQFLRQFVFSKLSQFDVPIITHPEIVVDGGGFLKDEFLNDNPDDVHHGNSRYGELMVKKIGQFITDRQPGLL